MEDPFFFLWWSSKIALVSAPSAHRTRACFYICRGPLLYLTKAMMTRGLVRSSRWWQKKLYAILYYVYGVYAVPHKIDTP
jgi:hypothetical protein